MVVLQSIAGSALNFLVIPNAKERAPSFYDVINLTEKESLEIQADQSTAVFIVRDEPL